MFAENRVKDTIIKILRSNIGLKKDEKLLILADVPTNQNWYRNSYAEISEFVKRSIFAKFVSRFVTKNFPECIIEFYTFPTKGRHGANPGKSVEEMMMNANAVIAMTSYSITHTDACENASKSGTRIASMPMFLPEMFYPNGSLNVDYERMYMETEKIVKLLSNTEEAEIHTDEGTSLELNFKNRKGKGDTGILVEKGSLGNLPAGEAFIAPIENTATGKVVIPKGWFPRLGKDLEITLKDGTVVDLVGDSQIENQFRGILHLNDENGPYISRRMLAEFGIGTNPKAKLLSNVLEAEKIRGTVHIALGDNSHFDGKNRSDFHQDFIIPKATLILDKRKIIDNGKILIS